MPVSTRTHELLRAKGQIEQNHFASHAGGIPIYPTEGDAFGAALEWCCVGPEVVEGECEFKVLRLWLFPAKARDFSIQILRGRESLHTYSYSSPLGGSIVAKCSLSAV